MHDSWNEPVKGASKKTSEKCLQRLRERDMLPEQRENRKEERADLSLMRALMAGIVIIFAGFC
jgi:hypothetical protein